MGTYRVILKPKSAISGYPSSDTLFGAIMWAIREVSGEQRLKDYIQRFITHNPPFIISSCFPVVDNGVELLFLPKPCLFPLRAEVIETIGKEKIGQWNKKYLIGTFESYKRFRKAKYVSTALAKKLLSGLGESELFKGYLTKNLILSLIGEEESADYGDEIILFAGLLLLKDEFTAISKRMPKGLFAREIIIRNTIDRLSASTAGEGQLFYTEETFVARSLFSLYFLICMPKAEQETLISAFKYLEDTGIGRDRTIGRNQFEISEAVPVNIDFNTDSNRFICLSRYIPKGGEIIFPLKTPYELISIHSKVESRREFKGEDIWKRHFFYFSEGSVLEAKERRDFYGITPEAKKLKGQVIIQNGLCLPLFGKIGD